MSIKLLGAVSGVEADVGALSKALYAELRNDLGGSLSLQRDEDAGASAHGLLMMGSDTGLARIIRVLSTGSLNDSRCRLFWDPVVGAAVNTQLWTQSLTTQTMTQANGVISFNASAITTINTMSIITSTKQFAKLPGVPLLFRTRARMNYTSTNSVMEFGFGAPTSFTPAIQNGAFFRRNAVGELRCVVSNAGVETESAVLATLDSAKYYTFAITYDEDNATFFVQEPGQPAVVNLVMNIPAAQASEMAVSHIPVFGRQYHHTSAPSAGTVQLTMTDVAVFAIDELVHVPLPHQQALMQKSTLSNPLTTFAQLATDANSAIAAVLALSNTTASLATLGGRFQFNAVAGAETDYALVAYLNVAPFQMAVTNVVVSVVNMGATVATTPTLLEWSLGAQSTAVTLATASPPMHRTHLGHQSLPVGAVVGTTAETIRMSLQTPIVVDPGRYFHVILRMPVGTATASQVIRGKIGVMGYFL